ncbi:MAG: metal-binding protein [Thermoprotei archaeon]|nr:MAG: metal-binding protein [Thermoprotei archaeon]
MFYVRTSKGQRCALLNSENWKLRRDRLIGYCNNGGRGCTILANYLKKVAKK